MEQKKKEGYFDVFKLGNKKFIREQNQLDTLRFITCGSVDDGKSTLLGRMLYEAQLIFDDQVEGLVKDSKKLEPKEII